MCFVIKFNVAKATVVVGDANHSKVKINGVDCQLFDGDLSKIGAFKVLNPSDLDKFKIGQDLSQFIQFGDKSDPSDEESSLYRLTPAKKIADVPVDTNVVA